MHKSDLALHLASRMPGLAKAVLRLSVKALHATGNSRQATGHWFVMHLADTLQYRVPIEVRLMNGMKILVHANDHVGGEIVRNGFYERPIVRLLERFLEPGMTFVDAGAHVGQYTLVASGLVGPTGAVHTFEPDPETYRCLQSNVRRNGLHNVTATRAALSTTAGVARFFLSYNQDIGSNSLRQPRFFSGRVCDVDCVPLDRYLADRGVARVDMMKVDVEGGEASVLKGAAGLLTGPNAPLLIVEFEEARQQAFDSSCAGLADLLRGYGYRLFRIGPPIEPYEPRTPEASSFNVFAVPAHREALLEELDGQLVPVARR